MVISVEHVVPYIGEGASGPAWSVPALCSAISQQVESVRLHTLGPLPDRVFDFQILEYPRHAFPQPKFGRSPEMRRALRDAAASADILHNHSLWMLPNIYPAAAVRGTRCRLVVSPRGTLSEYALGRSKWLKRLVMAYGQRRMLEEAACMHATAENEYEDIRRMDLRAPVAIIPNGVDVPTINEFQRDCAGERRRLLFLSRIDPKKGIEFLLGAWRELEAVFPEWELRIVGPDQSDHASHMRRLLKELGCQRVSFPGAAHGEAKSQEYWNAHLFVLPTHSENFGMAVAEALAHGVPAIVTKGAPWGGLETEGCGWWINLTKEELTECLREAMDRSPNDLQAMGARGRAWMMRDFCWQEIGRKMHKTYEWLLSGGPAPAWVKEA